jgi:hypothetical protein
MTTVLLQATETSAQNIKQDYGNLVFCGVFLLAAIGVGIWWLRRG